MLDNGHTRKITNIIISLRSHMLNVLKYKEFPEISIFSLDYFCYKGNMIMITSFSNVRVFVYLHTLMVLDKWADFNETYKFILSAKPRNFSNLSSHTTV